MIEEELKYFENLLNNLQFDKLEEMLKIMPFKEMEDILYKLAYDPPKNEGNLLVYTLMQKILAKNDTARMHLSMSRLMGVILNHIEPNAESIGLYHGLRAIELDRDNIDIMEYLLYYNHIPEKLLDDTTAIGFAQKIVKQRPDSKAALITLSKALD